MRRSARSVLVACEDYARVFQSVTTAAAALGMPRGKLQAVLSEHIPGPDGQLPLPFPHRQRS